MDARIKRCTGKDFYACGRQEISACAQTSTCRKDIFELGDICSTSICNCLVTERAEYIYHPASTAEEMTYPPTPPPTPPWISSDACITASPVFTSSLKHLRCLSSSLSYSFFAIYNLFLCSCRSHHSSIPPFLQSLHFLYPALLSIFFSNDSNIHLTCLICHSALPDLLSSFKSNMPFIQLSFLQLCKTSVF